MKALPLAFILAACFVNSACGKNDASAASANTAAAPVAAQASTSSSTLVAAASAPAGGSAASSSDSGKKLYTVVDGFHVDPATLNGFHVWRAAACARCHGANQEGMVGPSLINSLKILTKQQFVQTLTDGRLEKGMPSWKTNKQVMDNIDDLYAYLKGRSDGAITKAHVLPIEK